MKLHFATGRVRWKVVLGVGAAVALHLTGAGEDGGMYDGPPRFHDVNGWRGTIVATAKPTAQSLALIDSVASKAGRWTLDYNCYYSIDFLLDQYEEQPSTWTGHVTGSSLDSSYRWLANFKDGSIETKYATAGVPAIDPGSSPDVQLRFHRERGWSVHFPLMRLKSDVREVTILKDLTLRNEQTSHVTIMGATNQHPYPANGLILFQSDQKKIGSFNCTTGLNVASPELEWDYTIYLEPTSLEELRLVIEEPGNYTAWRPETTPDAGAGPALAVTARVETVKGAQPKTQVEQFIWELEGTSKEPGVAMNWPLNASDSRFDLELEAAGGHLRVSDDKQKVERAIQAGFTDTVQVVPHDWGGWSTLQVTAVMADGRRIKGKLKGRPDAGLRLPKRAADSHIADGWKEQHKGGADDLDDEKVAGQPDHGDGFTLYEEYRGWVVDGAHLDGDPGAKDFFVLNLIGADAQAGLDLFAGVSELAVHDRLKPAEMSQDERLMNGNHRQGAHAVDQHGVWIKEFGSKSELGGGGAFTTMTEAGIAGRPGRVKGIGILGRTNPDSDFNQPFNLAASDMIFAYDRAIAHELLHSVGVEHHGEADYRMIVGYCSVRNPFNKLGRPYYGRRQSEPVELLTEAGEDVAQRDYPEYVKFREFNEIILLDRFLKEGADYIKRNGVGYNGYNTPQDYADYWLENVIIFCFMHLNGIVGAEHGEHAGAEDCLMRYYFAKFYESKRAPAFGDKQYYLVGEGTERIGMAICRDQGGTGVNAPGHVPQSRYGDAAAGDCFAQICPNDAVPPRKTK